VGFDVTDLLQIRFFAFVNTGEKLDLQCDSISAIRRLQESLLFNSEGSIVQYSHRVWGTHETS
jgi:hypothetical protein